MESPNSNSSMIIGAAPPPPHVVPNFVNPDSTGHQVVILNAVMLSLSTLFVAMRLFTRLWIVRVMRADDYLLLVAWILSISLSGMAILHTKYGLGVHIWDVPLTTFSPSWLRLNWIAITIYFVITLLVKLSLLAMYLSIHPGTNFRRAVYVIVIFVVVSNISAILGNIFGCSPIAKTWDVTIEGGKCANALAYLLSTSALNLTSDLAMIILPIPMLWKLFLPWKEKVALMGIFMIGSSVCIMSAVRLRYSTPAITDPDATFSAVNLVLWTDLEIHTSIICACMPVLKPLLRRFFPSLFDNRSTAQYNSSSHVKQSAKCSRLNSQEGSEHHIRLENIHSQTEIAGRTSEGPTISRTGTAGRSDWSDNSGSRIEPMEEPPPGVKDIESNGASIEYLGSREKSRSDSGKENLVESGWDPLQGKSV